eukprot:1161976-Pelagomonas_calceolata.AAC.9
MGRNSQPLMKIQENKPGIANVSATLAAVGHHKITAISPLAALQEGCIATGATVGAQNVAEETQASTEEASAAERGLHGT